jgi:NAD(P)-dependent dehydrogenase (short-subunit alcohol dehydrogenase family)
MTYEKLTNKTALVTGGTSGIGFATAKEFIKQGAKVVITGRDEKALNAALAELGESASGLVADSSRISDIEETMNFIKAKHGQLDVLFYNAGIALFMPMEQFDVESYRKTFEINTFGAFFTVQKAIPLLSNGARIILNGSINAHLGMPNSSVYAASKAALLSFARTMTAELIGRKIRVNVVSPGPVETPLYGKLGLDSASVQKMAEQIQSQIPLGRFGKSEEIAKAVTFLASEDSEYIVGTELVVDGGMSQL